eukprot:TRINITY_DN3205_c0_g1_i2.p1 TRINITY_DN3205_c0_g1~~TRINITY_DN3205_c0_g1_i2.p1  ORF type:complete len:273 (-),score=53.98 TRINITY_DN3205_c0_g1_i2:12-830(-)
MEWTLFGFLFVFLFYLRPNRFPTALILFLIGLTLAIIKLKTSPSPVSPSFNLTHEVLLGKTQNGTVITPSIGFYWPPFVVPNWEDIKTGFLNAGLGQLPLTALNSVIALAALANELFPEREKMSITHVAVSVGLMNLIGGFFGSIPYCHGSGGLAAQYRFGARSGISVILLGIFKLLFGLFFGESLLHLLSYFPNSLLSVLLFISGLELCMVIRNMHHEGVDKEVVWKDYVVLLVTAGGVIIFKNVGVGFVAGCVVAVLMKIQMHYFKWTDQ